MQTLKHSALTPNSNPEIQNTVSLYMKSNSEYRNVMICNWKGSQNCTFHIMRDCNLDL